MTFDTPTSPETQVGDEHELNTQEDSAHKFTQQDLLKGTAIELNINQEDLAELMCIPWGTFRKWILPSESKDYRRMPDLVIRTVQLLLEVRELKRQLRRQ